MGRLRASGDAYQMTLKISSATIKFEGGRRAHPSLCLVGMQVREAEREGGMEGANE